MLNIVRTDKLFSLLWEKFWVNGGYNSFIKSISTKLRNYKIIEDTIKDLRKVHKNIPNKFSLESLVMIQWHTLSYNDYTTDIKKKKRRKREG